MSDASAKVHRVYHVREVLGRGGFGTVYRADLVTEGGFTKPVALKVLHDDAHTRPDHLARLRDEARMLGLIRHRALVGADALVRLDGRWTVVMEYVPGVSLAALRKRLGGMPAPVVAAIGAEVADALHAAFTAELEDGRPLQLVHRDLKPSNLQLTDRGDVKVLDFGVARADFDHREAETRQVVYGSPPYLSPERLEGIDSHAGDVFALGITLGELLSGRAGGPAKARPAQHDERVAALLEGVALPPPLDELLPRMLDYDAGLRPSAQDVARALRGMAHRAPEALAAFAAVEVPRERRALGELPGELTGHRLTEESEVSELQALAAGVPTTWNDQIAAPTLLSNPGTTWDGDISTLPTVIPTDAFLPAEELPTPPIPRAAPVPTKKRSVRLLAMGMLSAVGLMGVVAVTSVTLLVLIMIYVLGAGASFMGDLLCDGACGTMADHLDKVQGDAGPLKEARQIQRDAQRACARDDMDSFYASRLANETQRAVADGRLDKEEVGHLRDIYEAGLR